MNAGRLPLTVIGGYLGAGKTTLINRLLAEDHGQRLLVMVNDFGAINIDAELLESADKDTLRLTNGCVCCTMGADLFMAMGDALDRTPRPDHLIIEASGIANPARIAQAAQAEPDMVYGGVAVLVDAENFSHLAQDTLIGAQICDQIRAADLVCISKTDIRMPWTLGLQLAMLTKAPQIDLAQNIPIAPLLLNRSEAGQNLMTNRPHPHYAHWQHQGLDEHIAGRLNTLLATAPDGAFRIKGIVLEHNGAGLELHKVGAICEVRPCPRPKTTSLVAIGLTGQLKTREMRLWWNTAKPAH